MTYWRLILFRTYSSFSSWPHLRTTWLFLQTIRLFSFVCLTVTTNWSFWSWAPFCSDKWRETSGSNSWEFCLSRYQLMALSAFGEWIHSDWCLLDRLFSYSCSILMNVFSNYPFYVLKLTIPWFSWLFPWFHSLFPHSTPVHHTFLPTRSVFDNAPSSNNSQSDVCYDDFNT